MKYRYTNIKNTKATTNQPTLIKSHIWSLYLICLRRDAYCFSSLSFGLNANVFIYAKLINLLNNPQNSASRSSIFLYFLPRWLDSFLVYSDIFPRFYSIFKWLLDDSIFDAVIAHDSTSSSWIEYCIKIYKKFFQLLELLVDSNSDRLKNNNTSTLS